MLIISETKPDRNLINGQFLIGGYHPPFRYVRNKNGEGAMLYVGEDILFKNTISMLYNSIENHLELVSRSL